MAKASVDLTVIQVAPEGAKKDDEEQLAAAFEEELASYAAEASPHDEDVIFNKKIRIAIHKREMQQIDDLLTARKDYAEKIYLMVVYWLIGVAFILVLTGWTVLGFDLNEKVLLALIGGTTVNVLGIFAIVANFLFPKGQKDILDKLKKNNELGHSEITKPRKPKRLKDSLGTSK